MSSSFTVQPRILALDFDGVIADSIQECLVVGYNAHATLERKHPGIRSLAELDTDAVASARRLRPFIRSGQDYVYLFHALERKERMEDQEAFDRFTASHASLHDDFYRTFYRERRRLLEEHPEDWIRLNPLYPGMQDFLSRYESGEHLFIITTKQISFVLRILSANGIPFIQANALHADEDKPKAVVISGLLHRYRMSPSDVHFIDDQVDTLLRTKPLGIRAYAADWGYIDEGQRLLARRQGLELLTRDAFYRRFSKNPPPR